MYLRHGASPSWMGMVALIEEWRAEQMLRETTQRAT